ncbi:accessory factor UbiK family protein [Marinicauda sp. Alg238-R41]|nr:accessory factor UbiK family protein [Marinicauda sp. Alg238-R41]
MQSRNPIFADIADLMTDAFGAAQAAGEEARTMFRARAERMASDLDLVSREEFDAVKARLDALGTETESLRARIAELEGQKAAPSRKPSSASKRPAAKKS